MYLRNGKQFHQKTMAVCTELLCEQNRTCSDYYVINYYFSVGIMDNLKISETETDVCFSPIFRKIALKATQRIKGGVILSILS